MKYVVTGSKIYDDKKEEYEVLEDIGSGGFGIVFRLKKIKDDTIFALKTLQIGFSEKEHLDSFRHEGEAALEIESKNVIKYFFFHNGDLFEKFPPYIIMEYAEKGSLSELIDQQKNEGFFDNEEIKYMFKELITGMKAINDKIIHRDLKPANILISDNLLKITDFGLSKVAEDDTRASTFKGSGTLSYMSPEAWRLEENTLLMDIYSMGLIFYEIATLEYPYKDEVINSPEDWKRIHLYKNPKNPDIINSNLSPVMVQLIQKMIAKSPSDRFEDWTEVEDFLEKDDLPQTNNTNIIDKILAKKTQANNEKIQKRLSEEAREKEKKEKRELVQFMFNEKIVIELDKFIEELNSKSSDDQVIFKTSPLGCTISFNNGKKINIECSVIYEEDFYRDKSYTSRGVIRHTKEVQMPKLRDKNIIAWGIIKSTSQKGFNLVLVEKENDPYGEWILLINKNHVFYQPYRDIEPFELDYRKLEEALPNITATSQINMEDEPLNLKKIYDLIDENII